MFIADYTDRDNPSGKHHLDSLRMNKIDVGKQ